MTGKDHLLSYLIRDQGVGGSNPLSPTNIFSEFMQLARTGKSCRGTQFSFRP
jgi:hypothetical protein